MGGVVSACADNDELVDKLKIANYIKGETVEKVFRLVDRGDYITKDDRSLAYRDNAWRSGNLHLSAPCIYAKVLEGLELEKGNSFLNLGSGTGYFSTMVGLIIGCGSINHGVELHSDVINYATERLSWFKSNCCALDALSFGDPHFVQGNALCLSDDCLLYDRVYCGAQCPNSYDNYVKRLIKVGGILVIPCNDQLLQIRRIDENEYKTVDLLSVSFSSLIQPGKHHPPATVNLPSVDLMSLQEMCRQEIRSIIRSVVEAENEELSIEMNTSFNRAVSVQPTVRAECPVKRIFPNMAYSDGEEDSDTAEPSAGGDDRDTLIDAQSRASSHINSFIQQIHLAMRRSHIQQEEAAARNAERGNDEGSWGGIETGEAGERGGGRFGKEKRESGREEREVEKMEVDDEEEEGDWRAALQEKEEELERELDGLKNCLKAVNDECEEIDANNESNSRETSEPLPKKFNSGHNSPSGSGLNKSNGERLPSTIASDVKSGNKSLNDGIKDPNGMQDKSALGLNIDSHKILSKEGESFKINAPEDSDRSQEAKVVEAVSDLATLVAAASAAVSATSAILGDSSAQQEEYNAENKAEMNEDLIVKAEDKTEGSSCEGDCKREKFDSGIGDEIENGKGPSSDSNASDGDENHIDDNYETDEDDTDESDEDDDDPVSNFSRCYALKVLRLPHDSDSSYGQFDSQRTKVRYRRKMNQRVTKNNRRDRDRDATSEEGEMEEAERPPKKDGPLQKYSLLFRKKISDLPLPFAMKAYINYDRPL